MQLVETIENLNEVLDKLRELRNELKSDSLIETDRIVEELDEILGDNW
jgi:hypothetical protein